MKKLVFFIGGLNFGGMERVVFIANELLKDEYDITIVTLYQTNADYSNNFKYYNLDVSPTEGKINKLITFIKRLIKTRQMKRELKPDVVVSFGMYLNYLSALTKKNERCIMPIRSYDWLVKPFTTSYLDKKIINKADSVNSVSKVIEIGAKKYWNIDSNAVIYNPYNLAFIEEKSNELVDDFKFENGVFYIISVGRLAKQKGFDHLIKSFFLARKKINNIELIILGDGELKDELKLLSEKLHIEKYVHILGGKINPYKYMAKCNLYVLTSLNEGFPNALVEAMASGLPILSVDCKSGPREILAPNTNLNTVANEYSEEEYGVLVPPVEETEDYLNVQIKECDRNLEEGIVRMYNNDNLRFNYIKKGREHVKEYNYNIFKKKLIEEIEGK